MFFLLFNNVFLLLVFFLIIWIFVFLIIDIYFIFNCRFQRVVLFLVNDPRVFNWHWQLFFFKAFLMLHARQLHVRLRVYAYQSTKMKYIHTDSQQRKTTCITGSHTCTCNSLDAYRYRYMLTQSKWCLLYSEYTSRTCKKWNKKQ